VLGGATSPELDLVGGGQIAEVRWAVCEFCPDCGQRIVDDTEGHRDECPNNQPRELVHDFWTSNGHHITLSVGPLIPVYEIDSKDDRS
jgi:hypothetical protein